MKNYFLSGFMVFLFSWEVYPQIQEVNRDYKDKITGWLKQNHVPAVGIGIIEHGEVKDADIFGELKENIAAPQNTVFNVASLTKPITAMLTLKLISAGKWNLDESLAKFWIDPDIKNDPRHLKLTTRTILSHQTGFPNWRWDNGSNILSFEFDPGSKYQYSGEGFEYLRKAIEAKFGKTLDELAKVYLFQPLLMSNTWFIWNTSIEPRFAAWHDREGKNKYETIMRTGVSAADDLMTTVEDYLKFGVDVLKGAGLTEQLFKEMASKQVFVKEHIDYGLGWMIVKDLPNSEYALVHTGADKGVRAAVILLPKSQRGLVVMTNGDSGMQVIRNVVTTSLDVGHLIVTYMN